MIAKHYIAGWFFVDFFSIFPFNSLLDSGPITKLFRLCRVPRLMKILDVERFNKVLKSFQNDQSNHITIMKHNKLLYMYHIFRLILIALIITYFMGCIFFFVSDNFNSQADEIAEKTFSI
jgi:hypothetical protein